MEIGRRQLLGLGASVALAGATASCRSDADGLPERRPETRLSPRSGEKPGRAAFPGEPPAGHLYYGATLPHDRSLADWERELGRPLAVNRSFFRPERDGADKLVQRCLDDISHRRLPHVSMKPRGTWRDMARGTHDEWLAGMLAPLAASGAPVFFTLHHEPEDDAGPAGMQPADFVAMQRRLIQLAAGTSPRVVVCPVLQQWTFDPVRDDVDPAAWIVEEASVMGLDVYNDWSPTNGKAWRSFSSMADEAMAWLGDVPIAIGEYGCRDDPRNPGLTAEWLRDAAQYAREHRIVSMSYYNSYLNAPEGTWELRGRAERAFADLLASPWVARPR